MIRVVVAVLVALALVGASLPAVEHVGGDRSDAQARAAVHDLDTAATDLARSEEAVPGTRGARRVVTVTLPAEGVASAPVRRLAVEPEGRRYRYRVDGRSPRTVRGTVPVYTPDGEALVLQEAGSHRLVLALVDVGGSRRVVVARLDAAVERGLA